MHPNGKGIFVTLSIAASLACAAAWGGQADGAQPGNRIASLPVPTPTQTAISYDCRFEGGSSGKTGGWFKHCHAEGEFPNPAPTVRPSNVNGTLKLVCDDGGDDARTLYNDGAKTRLDRDDRTLSIRGLHSVEPYPPVITVSDIDQNDLCPLTLDGQRRFSSQLEFSQHGYDYLIPGSCKFTCAVPVLN